LAQELCSAALHLDSLLRSKTPQAILKTMIRAIVLALFASGALATNSSGNATAVNPTKTTGSSSAASPAGSNATAPGDDHADHEPTAPAKGKATTAAPATTGPATTSAAADLLPSLLFGSGLVLIAA